MERKIINIAKFLDRKGRIVQIPAKTKTLLPVLQYAASKLDEGKRYTQPEINQELACWHTFEHSDTLRRHLVERGFVSRTKDGRAYWKTEECINEMPYWAWNRKEY